MTASTWHVPDPLLRAWQDGSAPDEQLWSVEAHLLACPRCRERVAGALAVPALDPAAPLPVQGRVRPSSLRRRGLALLGLGQAGAAYLAAVVVALVAATLLDLATRRDPSTLLLADHGSAWLLGRGSWLTLIAPLLPVAGVALAYGPGLDPAYEIVAATPLGGLRLVLWRTLGVLLTAVPLTSLMAVLVRGRMTDGGLAPPAATLWLLPALALCTAALALGSLIGVGSASAVVGGIWAVGALGPALLGHAPPLLTRLDAPAWALVAAAGAAVLLARGDRTDRLHAPAPWTRRSTGGLA